MIYEINVFKGIFILLIVVGHDDQLTDYFYGLEQFLYYFHVHAFLILPFLFPLKGFSKQFLVDRAFRYLVPYVVFLTLSSLMLLLLEDKTLVEYFSSLFKAIFIASTPYIRGSSGLALYWFLPALFSLMCLRLLAFRYFYYVLIASVLFICFNFLLPVSYQRYIPYGLNIALYIYPVGLLTAKLCSYRSDRSLIISGVFFCFSSSCLFLFDVNIDIAMYQFASLSNSVVLLLAMLAPVSAFYFFYGLSFKLHKSCDALSTLLQLLGKYSLIIYLVHLLVLQLLYLVLNKVFHIDPIVDVGWFIRIVCFLIAIFIPIVSIKLLNLLSPRVNHMIFPNTYLDFIRSFRQ